MQSVLPLFFFLIFISSSAQAQLAAGLCADAVQNFVVEEKGLQSASVSLISHQELATAEDGVSSVSEVYEVFGRRHFDIGHVGRMQGLESHKIILAMTLVSSLNSESSACEMQDIQVNP